MKAAMYERYGAPEVISIRDVPKPAPCDHEILVRVRATTVSTGDWRARTLAMPPGFGIMGRAFFGFTGPRQPVLGTELAGDVEAVGRSVTRFKVGDRVFAFTGAAMGCHAEYKCLREDGQVERIPANLSYDSAAALSFGAMTALSALRRAKVQKGDTVLIVGASGSVGSAAIQVARHMGAEVTAVCSTSNLEMVAGLGAAQLIDYTTTDFTKNGVRYDVIMDTTGTAPFSRVLASLKPDGRFIPILGSFGDVLRGPFGGMLGGPTVVAGPAKSNPGDLTYLAKLAESGELTPFIDRRYPFAQIADAHRHVETGRKRGNVVVVVE